MYHRERKNAAPQPASAHFDFHFVLIVILSASERVMIVRYFLSLSLSDVDSATAVDDDHDGDDWSVVRERETEEVSDFEQPERHKLRPTDRSPSRPRRERGNLSVFLE